MCDNTKPYDRSLHEQASLGEIYTLNENNEEFQDRQDWLETDRSRLDIEHYLNGGQIRNLTARYKMLIQKMLI